MEESNNSKDQVIKELRQRVAKLEKLETERKRVEEALRESEEKFRSIVENSHAGILIVGEDYKFTYVNDELCRILQYPREEIIGHDFREFLDEEGKLLVADRYIRRQRGEKVPPRYEFNAVRKEGKKRRVEISSTVIKDSTGRLWTVAQILDITERKNAEKSLRESEEKYRTLTENINIGIYRNTVGPKGKFIEANPAIIRMFGYSDKEEFLEINVSGLYQNPEDRKKFSQKMLKDGFVRNEELQLKKKDRTLFYGSVSAVAVKDEKGKVKYYDGMIEDITERKKAEAALLESEKRFRELFNNMSSGVAVYEAIDDGKDFIFKDINNTGEIIDDVKKEEIIGKSILEVFPGVVEFGLFGVLRKVWETGRPEYHPITFYKDDRIRGWRENYVYKLPLGEIVVVYDDVTERKRLEDQREKARREAEFYADVLAHDVGNIDQITMGYLYLLQTAKDEETKKKNVNGIKKSIMKSARLAESIKMLKKIEETKLEKFDLNNSIERSIEKIKAYIDREIQVNLNIDKKYNVKANIFLDKVFFNILENSVEFTFQDKTIIDIKTEEKDGFCNIHIRDRGIGIPKAKKEDILENLETLSKRTGMGLYLVKKILERFNGKFEIKDVEKGTEIVVSIPVMRKNEGSARNVHPQRSHKRNKRGRR